MNNFVLPLIHGISATQTMLAQVSAKLLIQLVLGELNQAFGYKKGGIISMIRTQKISCVHSLNVLY